MNFQDIEIECSCGELFVWSVGEQNFLQSLVDGGKKNNDGTPVTFIQPKRCISCRKMRKEQRAMRELRY